MEGMNEMGSKFLEKSNKIRNIALPFIVRMLYYFNYKDYMMEG